MPDLIRDPAKTICRVKPVFIFWMDLRFRGDERKGLRKTQTLERYARLAKAHP